jgi:hypothetical protein
MLSVNSFLITFVSPNRSSWNCGLSSRANYTDRGTATCRRSYWQLFADIGRHVVSMTDPYGRILGFLYRIRYFFFQVAPQLYWRGWADPVPDPLLLKKSSSAWNRTRTSGCPGTLTTRPQRWPAYIWESRRKWDPPAVYPQKSTSIMSTVSHAVTSGPAAMLRLRAAGRPSVVTAERHYTGRPRGGHDLCSPPEAYAIVCNWQCKERNGKRPLQTWGRHRSNATLAVCTAEKHTWRHFVLVAKKVRPKHVAVTE